MIRPFLIKKIAAATAPLQEQVQVIGQDAPAIEQRLVAYINDATDTLSGRANYLANASTYPSMRNEVLKQNLAIMTQLVAVLQGQMQDASTLLSALASQSAGFAARQTTAEAAIATLTNQQQADELAEHALAAYVDKVAAETKAAQAKADLVGAKAEQTRLDLLANSQADALVAAKVEVNRLGLLANSQADTVLSNRTAATEQALASTQQALGAAQQTLATTQSNLATTQAQLVIVQNGVTTAQQAAAAADAKATQAGNTAATAITNAAAAQATANTALTEERALKARFKGKLISTPTVTLAAGSKAIPVLWDEPFGDANYEIELTPQGTSLLGVRLSYQDKTAAGFTLLITNLGAVSLLLAVGVVDATAYKH